MYRPPRRASRPFEGCSAFLKGGWVYRVGSLL
nr:MAG TPA: hypothetical protein [Caudoviricetes sp.]